SITSLMTGQRAPRAPRGQEQGTQGGRAARVVVLRNLWFMNDSGRLDVMQVRTGISDGSSTQIFADDNFEGREVILRERL
ncbi:MAG: hypothetical protein FWB83_00420, partial [Treponema sp.]|nr:hypothetical protein [Treponema sp.]